MPDHYAPGVSLDDVAELAAATQKAFTTFVTDLPAIPFGSPALLPLGWRRAGKGRSVWRLVEEVIGQNLEADPTRFGLTEVRAAASEVDVWDLELEVPGFDVEPYVNVKTASAHLRDKACDVSKTRKLLEFFDRRPAAALMTATIDLEFRDDMTVAMTRAVVQPTCWLGDLSVLVGSNNNVRSAATRTPQRQQRRSVEDFLTEVRDLHARATQRAADRAAGRPAA